MINKITTLLIIILVNTNAIAQQAEYILGDQFFNYAIQDKDSKNYLGAINNLKISNDYYAKLGPEKDSLIGFNYYLIGQFKDSLKLDSGFYYFEKSYEKLSKYPNQFLYQINDIELYLSNYYQSIKPDVSAYYYKSSMISSDLLYGIPNYFSLSAANQLSHYYQGKSNNNNYKVNLDSAYYFVDYILLNDSNFDFSINFGIFDYKVLMLASTGKEEEIADFAKKYKVVIDSYNYTDYGKKVNALNTLSTIYNRLNDSHSSLKILQEECELVEQYFNSNDSLLSSIYNDIASIYCHLNDFMNARIYLEKAKKFSKGLINNNSQTYLDYLKTEEVYYELINILDTAIYYAQTRQNYILLKNSSFTQEYFSVTLDLARLYMLNYQIDKADLLFEQLYQEISDKKLQGTYHLFSNYLEHLIKKGDLNRAKQVLDIESNKINLYNADDQQINFMYQGFLMFAKVSEQNGNTDSVIYYYEQAISISKYFKIKFDNAFYAHFANFQFGNYYSNIENYPQAIRIYLKCIDTYQNKLSQREMAPTFLQLANCYHSNHNNDSAMITINRSQLLDLDDPTIAIKYYIIKSQIYDEKFHNLKLTLSYLDSVNMIIQRSPNDYINDYVSYIITYCSIYSEYNQKEMAILKLIEGVDFIQELKGDSSIILLNLLDNIFLETNIVNDKNLIDPINQLKDLKEDLLIKYNKKSPTSELQEQLHTMLLLNANDAIWYAHTIVKKEKLVDLLGYQMGLMYYYQVLSACHAQLNNMDSALYYASLNLDIVKKGLINTYNTKYNATINVLRCYIYKGDYNNYFKLMNYYKELKLDSLDLDFLHFTRLAYSSINNDSGFYYSDLLMLLKENSLNEKLFFLPFNERSKLLYDYRRDFDTHETILYRLRDEINLTDAYNSIIRSENMLLTTELISRKRQYELQSNPILKSLFEQKLNLQDSINNLLTNASIIESKKERDLMRLKKEQYENQREIFELLGDTLTSLNHPKNNFHLLKSNITDNEIVIHYRFIPGSQYEDSSLYYAFVYDKYSDKPIINCRFTKGQLNSILNNGTVDEIYSSNELYNLIFKPLEGVIKSTHNKLIIIPDEDLFKISFNAMRMENDSFLIDKKEIAVLSTVNELVGKKDNSGFKFSSSTNVLLYGAINYAEKDTSVISSIKNLEKDSEPYFVLNRNSKFKLTYLPGTLEEISSVSKLLESRNANYQIVKGDDAKEEKFYEYLIGKSPAILHFATHGYFLDDTAKTMDLENININNSLMQNGIFLSNSQKSWDEGIIRYDKSDGIINGLEIASTDLSNTDLVVLSACNSGRGKIISREGVYGLQKGFKLAGAKSILYTLWPIPDKETVLFITKFYQYLIDVKNPNLAYRKTVSELLLLDQYRATPSIWAGFVLVN